MFCVCAISYTNMNYTNCNVFTQQKDALKIKEIQCKVKYSYDEGYTTKDTVLYIIPVETNFVGQVYEMKLDIELSIKRLPIYLYYKNNKIYRLWKTYEQIIETESEEKLLENSIVVYQEDILDDSLDEGEEGVHHYISSNKSEGKYRESHFYECNDYGNTVNFWETFAWDENKMLLYYASGFSAGTDFIEIKSNISSY